MAYFDRFDIAEAHCVLEWDYNKGGWLQERPSNWKRREATSIQLGRIQFKPSPSLCYEELSDNSKEIYLSNVLRWNLPRDEEQNQRIKDFFAPDWLRREYPQVFQELHT